MLAGSSFHTATGIDVDVDVDVGVDEPQVSKQRSFRPVRDVLAHDLLLEADAGHDRSVSIEYPHGVARYRSLAS